MSDRSVRTAAAGFTLVEIVFAMGILALGILSSISLMRWVVQGTAFNTQNTSATFLAQGKIEQLMAMGYSNVVSGSDTTQTMTRVWTVTSAGDYKTIDVSVSWTGVDNQPHSTSMKSIVAQ